MAVVHIMNVKIKLVSKYTFISSGNNMLALSFSHNNTILIEVALILTIKVHK